MYYCSSFWLCDAWVFLPHCIVFSSWNAIPVVLWMDLQPVLILTNRSKLFHWNKVWADDSDLFYWTDNTISFSCKNFGELSLCIFLSPAQCVCYSLSLVGQNDNRQFLPNQVEGVWEKERYLLLFQILNP